MTKASEENSWSSEEFTVSVDGEAVHAVPGTIIRLQPGQSVCIPPRTIHQFWGEEGKGIAVSGEVSSLCDDQSDNFFLGSSVRYPSIEEDEERAFYLCNEYPPAS